MNEQQLRDIITEYTCSKKCMGVRGNAGGCCRVDDRDFIMGPVTDAADFLIRLSSKLKRKVEYDEIFIDFEEGQQLFPDRSAWREPSNYPAMRPDTSISASCKLYQEGNGCTVYGIRPKTCQAFACDTLLSAQAII